MEKQQFDPNPCELDSATVQRLSDLVSRAHARTSATGVAIALIQGNELVTCAAFGASAPEVGTRGPISAGFSGRCAQTGEMLICEDVMKDARVNGEACAAMGIYSMVMVPISDEGATRGVLGAFSDRPNSFSPSQITVLNTFAEITTELLHHRDQATSGETPTPVASVTDPSAKCETVLHDVLTAYETERRSRGTETKSTVTKFPEPRTPSPAPTLVPTPVTTSAPAASTFKPPAPEGPPEKFAPQIVRPSASRGAAATKMAVMPEPKPRPEPPKPEQKSDLLSFAADPMPLKTSGQVIGNPRAERSSPQPESPFLATLEAQRNNKSSSPMKFVIGAAAVVVLAGGVFGFSRLSHRTASVAAAAPAVENSAPATTDPTPQPAPVAAPTSTDTAKEVVKEAKVSEAKHTEDTKPAKEEHKAAEAKQADPMFIRSADLTAKKPSVGDVQAPTLLAGLSHNSMPQINATVVPPKADFPTASVTAPKLINGPRPVFPVGANALHLTGDTVVLNAKVMPNGKVGDVVVVRGKPVFVQAVKDAVKRWQYEPAQLNHQPTEATIEIVFKFGPGQ